MTTTRDRLPIDRDADLIDALRENDPAAAEALVATYGDRAYRLALRLTGNREDAEEALQDAFWNVTRKIGTFRGDSAFGSWVYRIVTIAAYQKLRGRARKGVEVPLDDVLPVFDQDGHHATPITDWWSSVGDVAVQRELRDELGSAIADLPPDYRAAILMRDVEGLSLLEVSDALGIPVATVKTRTHRARLKLRQRLANFMEPDHRHSHRNAEVQAVA